MEYHNVVEATFLSRPNRFIAQVERNGKEETVHVKNTGRCKELLVPHAKVYLEPSTNPNRKTKFSLIAVEKGNLLINMDSQAPNKVLEEALRGSSPIPGFPFPLTEVRREYTYGKSRLDFCLQSQEKTTLVEVKGVTLEEEGAVYFPDAPTQRGVKHLEELIHGVEEGYSSIACFIIQLEKARFFSPNDRTHPAFGDALRKARQAGVEILAFTCHVTPNSITLGTPVPIIL